MYWNYIYQVNCKLYITINLHYNQCITVIVKVLITKLRSLRVSNSAIFTGTTCIYKHAINKSCDYD